MLDGLVIRESLVGAVLVRKHARSRAGLIQHEALEGLTVRAVHDGRVDLVVGGTTGSSAGKRGFSSRLPEFWPTTIFRAETVTAVVFGKGESGETENMRD